MPAAIADEHRDAVLGRLDGGTSERRPLDAWAGDGVGPAALVESANEDALERAEAKWGVPPEIVVAIVGIETSYGRLTGSFRVIDALATLAFDYPRRAPFFRGELKEFLLLSGEQGFTPLVPKGSFAGAMGVPQFMPGSFRRYAVDFDGDARIDLWGSAADVVGSVANYLARHDWQPGMKWWSRTENAAMRLNGFGMIRAPAGNSAISTRCGYASAPKRASISATASGWRSSGTPSAAAAACRVRSSGVAPMPPNENTRSPCANVSR